MFSDEKFMYIWIGMTIGTVIAPVVAILTVFILQIDSYFLIILTSVVVGICMALAGKSIGEMIYKYKMEEKDNESGDNENSEINEETDNTYQS